MKIIQVTSYYPPHIGGQENAVANIAEQLAKNGNSVEVFTSALGHRVENVQKNNVMVHYLKSLEVAHTAIIPSLFTKLLQLRKDSLIHLHVAQAFTPEIVYILSLLKNIPYIAHIHADVQSSGKFGFLLPLYKKILLRPILQRATKILVPTSDYIEIISNKYHIDSNKFAIVPSGVHAEHFKKTETKLHNPIKILFVGRLSRQKNVPLLIEAFKEIVSVHPNTVLHIVGEGEDREKIVKLLEKNGLSEKVTLMGALQGEKLYSMFRNADIFISTSIYESFGIALVEAMAAGLVIIAPNIDAVKNVIMHERNGLLVEPTPQAYKDAFTRIIGDRQLQEKLKQNALYDVKKYSWPNIITGLEKIYKEVQLKYENK